MLSIKIGVTCLSFNPNVWGEKNKKINATISHSAHFELKRGDTPYHCLSISSLFELVVGGGGVGTMLTGYHPAHKLQVRRISSLLPTTVATRSNGASLVRYQHDTWPLWHQKFHLHPRIRPPSTAFLLLFISSTHKQDVLLSLL